jgi:DNA-binding transcriptional regulator YiaG
VSPDELVQALRELDLTQQGFARLMGHGERVVRYWIAGERSIPQGIAILVRLLVAGRISVADIEAARDGLML